METLALFFRIARREFRALFGGRLMRLLAVVLPSLLTALFTVIFWQGVPENLPVAVCDLDRTTLSRSIIRMADANPSMALFQVSDLEEGRRAVLSGKAYGLLVLPARMERDLTAGGAPASRLYVNNQIMLPAGVVKRAMMQVYGAVSAGVTLTVIKGQGVPESLARDQVAGIHVASRTLYNPHLDYRWYLYAGICPFYMKIFIMCATVWGVGGEIKRERVSVWLQGAKGRVGLALAGKLLPQALWFSLLGWGILALFFTVMEMPLRGDMATLMGGTVLYVVACQAVALFLVAFTGELAKAVSLMSLYAGSAFVFAGVTFPAEAMPLAARIWHETLPLTHMVQLLNDQALKGAPVTASLTTLGALLVIALVLGGAGWLRLSARLSEMAPEHEPAGGVA